MVLNRSMRPSTACSGVLEPDSQQACMTSATRAWKSEPEPVNQAAGSKTAWSMAPA